MSNDDPFQFKEMNKFAKSISSLHREPLDLGAIETRLAMATPGPWRVKEDDAKSLHRGTVQVEEYGRLIETVAECYCGGYDGHGRQNAELVAHAPHDLKSLIEEVNHLRMERTVARLAASMLAEAWKKTRSTPKSLTMPEAFKDNGHIKLYGDVILWGITEGWIDPDGADLTFDAFLDVWEKHRTWFHKEWLDHCRTKKMDDSNALDNVLEFSRKNLDVESLGR